MLEDGLRDPQGLQLLQHFHLGVGEVVRPQPRTRPVAEVTLHPTLGAETGHPVTAGNVLKRSSAGRLLLQNVPEEGRAVGADVGGDVEAPLEDEVLQRGHGGRVEGHGGRHHEVEEDAQSPQVHRGSDVVVVLGRIYCQ